MTRTNFSRMVDNAAHKFKGEVTQTDDQLNSHMAVDVRLPNVLQATLFSQYVIFDLMAKVDMPEGSLDYRDNPDPVTVTVTKMI
jgi:hypothetical protein